MKISTAKLKQLIREELFYREFYRDAPINESVGDLPAEIPIVRIGSGYFGNAHDRAFKELGDWIALLNNDSTFTILEKTPMGHRGASPGKLSVTNSGDYATASTATIDPEAGWVDTGVTLQLSDLTDDSRALIGAPANQHSTELQDKYVKLVEAELKAQGNPYIHEAIIEDILFELLGDDLEYTSQAFDNIVNKVIENATGKSGTY
jgi:hypothetical protein